MRAIRVAALIAIVSVGGYAGYATNDDVRKWADEKLGLAKPVDKSAKRKVQPAPVRVAKTARRDVPVVLDGVGNVQALSTVQIKSRIDGQVTEVAIKDGQIVEAGDLLFRLDDRPLAAQLRQAQASLGRDKANLEKAKSDVVRFGTLTAKGISPVTKLEEVRSSLAALEAAIRASEASVEITRLNLEYATIRAPISGRVGSVLLSAGNMVKANDTQAMLVITQTKPVNVVFTVPEKYVGELRRRMEGGQELLVDVSVPGDVEISERGRLFFVNNVVDTASGTIQVMARFDNKDEKLVPGQFTRASVTLEVLSGSVVAPSRAVQINQRGFYAWVVKADGTVEARSVEIGPRVGDDTVIREGLGPGETIVTDGQLRLFPGAPVKPLVPGDTDGKPKKVQS
jgi:membrane fusion protein, multidrug efflux system